jgi:hypothetical protein
MRAMRVMMMVVIMSQTVHEPKITKTANIVKTNLWERSAHLPLVAEAAK